MAFKTRRRKKFKSDLGVWFFLFGNSLQIVLIPCVVPSFYDFFYWLPQPCPLWPTLTYFDLLWRIVTGVYCLPHCQQTFYTSAVTPKLNIQIHIFFKWPHFLLKGHTFRPLSCTPYYTETTLVISDGVHASVIRCIFFCCKVTCSEL